MNSIFNLLKKRVDNRIEALKTIEPPINESDSEVKRLREIEAIRLRTEINVLKDVLDLFEEGCLKD